MSDQIEMMKRTASSEVADKYDEVINEIPLRVQTARYAASLFFVDDDYIKVWTKKLNQIEISRDILTAKERRIFISHLIGQYSKLTTEKLDPLSRVFIRSNSKKHKGMSWFLQWPECILSNFKETGTYGCIDGVPRSGKTSVACLFMPIFYNKFHLQTLTNIKINNSPEYVHYAQKLSEMVQLMDDTKNWICILDETATFADKKLALSTGNVDFENLSRFIGKMGGRLLMISHSFERDIPTRLQEWMTERYTKKDKKMMKIVLRGKNYKANEKITQIPDTDFQFLTEDITSLQFDISIKQLLQDIQDGISVRKALQRQKVPISNKQKIIKYLKKTNMTHKEISKKVGVSTRYVSYVKKEIKKK